MIIYSIRKIKIGPTLLTGATERSNHRRLGRLPVRARETWRGGQKEEMGFAGERSSSYSFLRRSLLGFYEAKIMKLHFVHCVRALYPLALSPPSVRFFLLTDYMNEYIVDISQEFSE